MFPSALLLDYVLYCSLGSPRSKSIIVCHWSLLDTFLHQSRALELDLLVKATIVFVGETIPSRLSSDLVLILQLLLEQCNDSLLLRYQPGISGQTLVAKVLSEDLVAPPVCPTVSMVLLRPSCW